MTSMPRDAIVIGGGAAGLSAAVRLASAGLCVQVLEARPHLGGRATAFRDPRTGEWVDNGQHLLLGCYHETFDFLSLVGAIDRVRVQPSLQVPFVDEQGVATMLTCATLPSPWHLVGGLVEWDALGVRDKLSAVGMLGPLRLARRALAGGSLIAASPGETVENWLIRNGQTRRIREMLWEPLALAALNQPASLAAAPVFARVLARMLGPDPRDAAVAFPLRPLHEVYAEPARTFIETHGGQVCTSAPAVVVVEGDRVVAVEAQGTRLAAPVVVVSVPWFAFSGLFADPPPALAGTIDRADRLGSSPIVTVNLWLDRPILDVPFVGLPGRTFQWIFDKRHIVSGGATYLSLVSSGAASVVNERNEVLLARAWNEVTQAFAAARGASVVHGQVIRERQATFSLAPGEPERPGVETAVAGLFLAGDWIDTGLPGTIEGAVVSGHAAARAVLARL
jgi:squalene-associated FAD-dependent desaturase